MGVNLAAMAVGARLFCQTTASLWQLPLPFLPAVTLKIILPGTLGLLALLFQYLLTSCVAVTVAGERACSPIESSIPAA